LSVVVGIVVGVKVDPGIIRIVYCEAIIAARLNVETILMALLSSSLLPEMADDETGNSPSKQMKDAGAIVMICRAQ
jgi:hypothetical protein